MIQAGDKSIEVRHAAQADAAELACLNYQFNEVKCTPCEMAVRLGNVPEAETVLVAEVEGAIVGFACLQVFHSVCYAAPWAELTELYVQEPFRRRGVGRELVSYAEQLVQQQGIGEMVLRTGEDNSVGQHFYRALSFEFQGDIVMDKQLNTKTLTD